ncbi:hypothetical protein LUZ60_012681 [Juncus effusus]|nr:hypothetical protein LUZ60_012681 [Juncus effusus]
MAGLLSLRAQSPTIFAKSTPNFQNSNNVSANFIKFGFKSRPLRCSIRKSSISIAPKASVESVEYTTEPTTNVKFPKELTVPGCSKPLILLGTGFREKVFAIIGVKVYAAGLFVGNSIKENLSSFNGKSAKEISDDSSIFNSIFNGPLEKSLNIKLVRDVDGKTFWNALNDVISTRVQTLSGNDENALSIFRDTFLNRNLKQGTYIFLTWVSPSKLLVSVSSEEFPSKIDTEIESLNVSYALFDGFFGDSPVSPSLKSSVINGLHLILN